MSIRKRKFGIELDAGIVEGPRGLSIGLVKFKETLPSGNNVYEVFLENNVKIGEFISNKGDEGKEGKEGKAGRGIVSVSKKEKIGLMTYYEISYTDNTVDEFAVEDGQNAYELWIGQGKEGDIEDFFEFYRGFSLDFTWRGTELGIKKSNEENYIFVDLRGEIGPNGKNLEFTWLGTELGVRLEGEIEYQFVNLIGPKGRNLEFIWRGTELGVRIEGETEYQYVDLVGQGTEYTLPIATSEVLGGVKEGKNVKIKEDGAISAFSLPIGTILRHPSNKINDIEFKKLNGEILESSSYPQLVGILQNARYETCTIPRRTLKNNNDDQLIVSFMKSDASFASSAHQTFGENANGIDYAFFSKYVGIKLDARNADYIMEYDETKHHPDYRSIHTIVSVKVTVKKIGYSIGIFGGEDGLQRIYELTYPRRLEIGEYILTFGVEEYPGETTFLKKTPITFRIFQSEGDISTNTSPGFTVDSVKIDAIWIKRSILYNEDHSLKYLMLPKEKMSSNEKNNQFGYDFCEYMYVGEAFPKIKSSYNFYSYNTKDELVGEVPFEIAVENELPSQIDGITLSSPIKNKEGYINKYNHDSDSWKLIKTHENKEGYYYDKRDDLKYIPKPSNWVRWDDTNNNWIEDTNLKEISKKELLNKYIELEIKKDKMVDLKIDVTTIVEEIEKIKKELEEING